MASLRKINLPFSLSSSFQSAVWDRGLKARRFLALVAVLLSGSAALSAQSPCAPEPPPPEQEGKTSGDYLVHSSFEMGYRSSNESGVGDMYGTLVDLKTGPRFLSQTFSMDSLDHRGLLFDGLSLTSCGWGGDPDNVLRLRVDKNKWYDLHGSFRRDQYVSNYDLLSNPLNPPSSSPYVPVLNSPTAYDTTRRMTDVDLTLLPQSRLSFRLGYFHNNMNGPMFDGIHEGTEGLLLNPTNITMNSFRMGADLRIAPRTVLSYDEFLDYYRGDTDAQLTAATPALLSNGTPVELGLSVDTLNSTPCALAKGTTTLISAGVLTNVNCSAYFGYQRDQRIRTSTPTERASLRSNYLQRVDLVGSFSYSDAEMSTPEYESFSGLITRTLTRSFVGTGTSDASRLSDNADAGVAIHLMSHLRLVNKFTFWAYRTPQSADLSETDNDCVTPNSKTKLPACTLLSTAPVVVTTPTLTLSSFNQSVKRDQTDLVWDISKKVGAHIGYRYGDRVFDDFASFTTGGETSITVHENTALAGIWARPTRDVRLNLDVEHTNYDNVIFPMAPRKESRYRFQTSYSLKPWAVVGGSVNVVEDANAYSLTDYVGHNRNYGLTASLAPRRRFGMDLAYNYNDSIQNAFVCFADTPPTGVSLPFVTGATACPQPLPTGSTTLADPLQNYSMYTNHTQFGMAMVRFKFDKRTTINAGGSITNVDGSIPQFNVLQPLGTAEYRFYQPVVYLSVDLGHNFAWNSGFNYYQYSEGSFVGPTESRYFHANNVTESVRYAF
jgi:hypothetical protein